MSFPREIHLGDEIFSIEVEKTKESDPKELFGLNAKKFYRDKKGNRYIAKVDKARDPEKDIFLGTVPKAIPKFPEDDKDLKVYQEHTCNLRDGAASANLISANVGKEYFRAYSGFLLIIFVHSLMAPLSFFQKN